VRPGGRGLTAKLRATSANRNSHLHPSLPLLRLIPSQNNHTRRPPRPPRRACLPSPSKERSNGEDGIHEPEHGRRVVVITRVRRFVDVAKVGESQDYGDLALGLCRIWVASKNDNRRLNAFNERSKKVKDSRTLMKSFNPLSCLLDQAISAEAMITMRR
jgi:hypothetical protein